MLETIAAIGHHTGNQEFRSALRRQADAIHRGSESGLKDSSDRKVADQRYQAALESLAKMSA